MVFGICLFCGVLVFVFGGLGGLGGVMWVCGILVCVFFWGNCRSCAFVSFFRTCFDCFLAGMGREVCDV